MIPSYPLFVEEGGWVFAVNDWFALGAFVDEELHAAGKPDAHGWDCSGQRVRISRDERGGPVVESEGIADMQGLRAALLEHLNRSHLLDRVTATVGDVSTASPAAISAAIDSIEWPKTVRRIVLFFVVGGLITALGLANWLRSCMSSRP
jgi:hypothetical protein